MVREANGGGAFRVTKGVSDLNLEMAVCTNVPGFATPESL